MSDILAQITATKRLEVAAARLRGFALATRNGADFESIGLSNVDPWVGS